MTLYCCGVQYTLHSICGGIVGKENVPAQMAMNDLFAMTKETKDCKSLGHCVQDKAYLCRLKGLEVIPQITFILSHSR